MTMPSYNPMLFQGCAQYYERGRPAYSRDLAATLAAEVGLNGSGRLLDAGCGPGILTVELAPLFTEAIGLDPDADMLAEAERRASERGIGNIRLTRGVVEEAAALVQAPLKLVTFGRSFHWTDRERAAGLLYDMLEPGGALAVISDHREDRPQPDGPGFPLVPADLIHDLLDRFLGPDRPKSRARTLVKELRHEDALARTRFGPPRVLYCPGRPDIVWDIDGVVAHCFSRSSSAPHLFGARAGEFETELRDSLAELSPTGLFWVWPGDTEIILAEKTK
jgi:SAM-dependent methyltransferase